MAQIYVEEMNFASVVDLENRVRSIEDSGRQIVSVTPAQIRYDAIRGVHVPVTWLVVFRALGSEEGGMDG